MNVSQLMVRNPVTCKETSPLGEVARLMWEHDIGFIPVLDDAGALAGVVTDRDAFMAAYFQGMPLWQLPARSAMSSRVATIRSDSDIDDAERIMAEFQVHRLPVVDGGKLVGVISINDLAREAANEKDEFLEERVALTLGAICAPRPAEV